MSKVALPYSGQGGAEVGVNRAMREASNRKRTAPILFLLVVAVVLTGLLLALAAAQLFR